jgi:hypothetical protein
VGGINLYRKSIKMESSDLIKGQVYKGSDERLIFRCFDDEGCPCFQAESDTKFNTQKEVNDNMNHLVHVHPDGHFMDNLTLTK